MKLNTKLIVIVILLLLITIHHTYSKQEKPVRHTKNVSGKITDTITGIDLLSPGNIILAELP